MQDGQTRSAVADHQRTGAAMELVETIRQPQRTRLLSAIALQNAAVELNDEQMNARATTCSEI